MLVLIGEATFSHHLSIVASQSLHLGLLNLGLGVKGELGVGGFVLGKEGGGEGRLLFGLAG